MIFFSFYLTHSLVSSHAEKDRWDRYYRAHKFILSCLVAFSARVKTMLRETCALLGVHIYVYIGCVTKSVFSPHSDVNSVLVKRQLHRERRVLPTAGVLLLPAGFRLLRRPLFARWVPSRRNNTNNKYLPWSGRR